jgi:TRAP-type mannitol/chloroaromatic compound transport system permease small subunit
MSFLAALDRAVAAILAAGRWLVLPVCLLLFLQWPLREIVQGLHRGANDIAQVCFAFYVSLAVTEATRLRAHLAADAIARRYAEATRRLLARLTAIAVLVPWSLFVLWAWSPVAWDSLRQLERFQETFNPGFFLVKLAVWVLALLVLAQGLLDALRPRPHS